VRKEITMKPFERLSDALTFRRGIIVIVAIVVLALSSESARRVGLAVLAATVVGVPSATVAAAENTSTAIRPFEFQASKDALVDLRRRIAATKWPERELVTDATQGVPLATMRELARYWQTDYDWRKIEARLNALPQFMTTIDGLDIHFIHVRSKNPNALPMIITHGWPGSIIEQMKIIDPLTNPTALAEVQWMLSTS
jgi:epoxide hydrolase-like protein